jgi:hypothetical protein
MIYSYLAARIKFDLGPQFPAQGWQDIPLGTLYFSPDPQTGLIVIDRMLGDVISQVLRLHGLMLTDTAWRSFVNGATQQTTPKQAVQLMLIAAATAKPIPATVQPLSFSFAPSLGSLRQGRRRGRQRLKHVRGEPGLKRGGLGWARQ